MPDDTAALHRAEDATAIFHEDPPVPTPQQSEATTFADGQNVGGRYRIVRLIGAGGMGEVYEAVDLELNEHIAIKSVRGPLPSAAAYERLKREIQLARRITHPNICRTFDLARHDLPGGAVIFVTMELLRGQTLAERIREQGRMTPEEALPIVRQIAAGLAAAHAQGIVHRDLKCDNVILTGERAVITDFGLARSDSPSSSDVTRPGEIIGTPAYIAPEQLQGAKVTTATDIYALGVILYELVTGTRPFDGSNALATVLRKLHEPASSPRLHVSELDRRWESVILRCLERRPEERFATVSDVVAALESKSHSLAPSQRRRRVRAAVIAAAALVLLGGAAVLWQRWPRSAAPGPRPVMARRPALAVVGFRNTTGRPDLDWLSMALSEMLTTELAAEGRIRTVSGDDVERARHELHLTDVAQPSRAALAQLSRNLNADLLVYGSYTAVGEGPELTIRLDARMQDLAGQGRDLAVAESGVQRRLFDVVSRAGARMRSAIGVQSIPEGASAVAILPSDPAAARAYAEGLARLRSFEALRARELFERALATAPDQPMVHFGLAAALTALGNDTRARAESKRAFELSSALPREQRLVVEAGYRESVADWPQAIEIHRSLMRFFPDNADYALRLANAQTRSGNATAALATLHALRTLPEPFGSDPRIDVAEIDAAAALTDYPRLQQAAARAIENGERRGARHLVARAWSALGVALHRQGRTDEALQAQNRALAMYREAGDRGGVGRSLLRIGSVHVYRGRTAEAGSWFAQAKEIGDAIGDSWLFSAARNNLAFCAFTRADPHTARTYLDEMIAMSHETGDRRVEATALDNLGYAAYLLGDLGTAEKRFREAAALAASMKSKQLLAVAEENIGDTLLAAGQSAKAREHYESALATRQQIGEKRGVAESQTALATLAVETARASEGEALARQAVEWSARAGVDDVETGARIALARALVAERRLDEAGRELTAAATLVAAKDNLPLKAQVAIADARLELARGRNAAAAQRLAAIPEPARRLTPIALESDLLQAEAAPAETRSALLADVQRRAAQSGFNLLARRAREARGSASAGTAAVSRNSPERD